MTPDHRLSKINEIIAMGVIRMCSERNKNSCALNLQKLKPSMITSKQLRKEKK